MPRDILENKRKNMDYSISDYKKQIIQHYASVWGDGFKMQTWAKGPASDLGEDFCILEFAPTKSRKMWTYATCCMSNRKNETQIEMHLFSSTKDESLVELLTAIAHYHNFGKQLGLWHTVNFGRPWKNGSNCCYGLISLPYLDGPDLETLNSKEFKPVKFYWLIPVTENEVDFKKRYGIERLEESFEGNNFNYLDPLRKSVV